MVFVAGNGLRSDLKVYILKIIHGVCTGPRPVANACYAPSHTECAHAGPRNLLMLATPMCLIAKYLICAKRKLITFTTIVIPEVTYST